MCYIKMNINQIFTVFLSRPDGLFCVLLSIHSSILGTSLVE